jgi:transglutaminase-like putative cysteine protease
LKRIRITHETDYNYRAPVTLGPHRALVRPREGHDLHITSSRLELQPEARVRWYRDIHGNSIAIITFAAMAQRLSLFSQVDVNLYEDIPIDWVVDPAAQSYPFQYDAVDQVDIVPYRLPSYPHDGPSVQEWLRDLYQPGQTRNTSDLLNQPNTRIYYSFRYIRREEDGVQQPCRTHSPGTESCRDFAVFMMEAAGHWGFASRFVSGYIQMGEGQHGATHAWTEIYLPGAGWRGFDPTNYKLAGAEHVSVAVARDHEKACPLSGSWHGPGTAFERMDVSVQVVAM